MHMKLHCHYLMTRIDLLILRAEFRTGTPSFPAWVRLGGSRAVGLSTPLLLVLAHHSPRLCRLLYFISGADILVP